VGVVFRHLDEEDLVKCAAVCRDWREFVVILKEVGL